MADTIIKRIGGKVKLAKWIIEHLPYHKIYCEPFAGSFAVGLALPPGDSYKMERENYAALAAVDESDK